MSLIKKSDVKNHLSAPRATVFPFGQKPSDTKTPAKNSDPVAQAKGFGIGISPRRPIFSGAVPNTQVGGSVGVPANAGQSGKASW